MRNLCLDRNLSPSDVALQKTLTAVAAVFSIVEVAR
jgi:hypothetical protein